MVNLGTLGLAGRPGGVNDVDQVIGGHPLPTGAGAACLLFRQLRTVVNADYLCVVLFLAMPPAFVP